MLRYLLVISDPTKVDVIGERVTTKFPAADVRKGGSTYWFIRSDLDTRQITDTLFDTSKPPETNFVIARMDAWWGWNDKSLWEWLSG